MLALFPSWAHLCPQPLLRPRGPTDPAQLGPKGTRQRNKGPLCARQGAPREVVVGSGAGFQDRTSLLDPPVCCSCSHRPARADSARLFPIPRLVTSRWQFEIGRGGSIYTTEIGRHHHWGLRVSGEPVLGHLPACHLIPRHLFSPPQGITHLPGTSSRKQQGRNSRRQAGTTKGQWVRLLF